MEAAYRDQNEMLARLERESDEVGRLGWLAGAAGLFHVNCRYGCVLMLHRSRRGPPLADTYAFCGPVALRLRCCCTHPPTHLPACLPAAEHAPQGNPGRGPG